MTWSDADILSASKEIKTRFVKCYDASKVVIYLSLYQGSARRMLYEYPDTFANKAEAKRIQEILFESLGAKLRKWQNETMRLAQKQHFLINQFGYKHFFYDVLTRDLKKGWKLGTQANEALAFLPQSTAAAIIKEAIRRIASYPFYRQAMRWVIHDSLLFELPKSNFEERLPFIGKSMSYAIPQLGGLLIETECKVGENWGEMAKREEPALHAYYREVETLRKIAL